MSQTVWGFEDLRINHQQFVVHESPEMETALATVLWRYFWTPVATQKWKNNSHLSPNWCLAPWDWQTLRRTLSFLADVWPQATELCQLSSCSDDHHCQLRLAGHRIGLCSVTHKGSSCRAVGNQVAGGNLPEELIDPWPYSLSISVRSPGKEKRS